jgi:hypothetical protein
VTFDSEQGIRLEHPETLYTDQADAAAKFESLMARPPPLQRWLQSAEWRDSRLPSSDGDDLLVANCYPDNSLMEQARERAAAFGIVPRKR